MPRPRYAIRARASQPCGGGGGGGGSGFGEGAGPYVGGVLGADDGEVVVGRGVGFALGCVPGVGERGAALRCGAGCSCGGGLLARQPEPEHATDTRQAMTTLALAAA